MYGFIDTKPVPGPIRPYTNLNTIFNGINLDEELTDDDGSFITLSIAGRNDMNYRINTTTVAGMDGVYEQNDASLDVRQPVVTFKLKDRTSEGFQERVNRLKSLLDGSKKILEFTDEDVYFYATVSSLVLPEEDSNDLVGRISFHCSDPYKYGYERSLSLPSDYVAVMNEGDAVADPIFQLIPNRDVTFAMVQKHDDSYQMVGRPADIAEEVPFKKYERIFFSDANNLTGWTTHDYVDMGVVAGEMEAGGRFQARTYGEGNRWHGPAIKHALPETLTDFRMTAFLSNYNGANVNRVGRVEIYMLDVNGAVVGKVSMKDSKTNQALMDGVARAGEMDGEYRYLISESGDTPGTWNDFAGHVRLEREGNRWNAYFAKVDTSTGRHYARRNVTWTDTGRRITRPVASVMIHMGAFGDNPPVTGGVSSINVYKINQPVDNGVPVIAGAGDVIVFDHERDEVLINGEPRGDLKDFGGSYFRLDKGENRFVILPENTFSASVRYKERFK